MRWKWIVGIIGLLVVIALIVIFYVDMVSYQFNKLKPYLIPW